GTWVDVARIPPVPHPGRGRMQVDRRPTWSWPELVACFLLGQIIPAATFQLFLRFGLYSALSAAERVADLKPDSPDQTRFMLYAVAIGFPFQIAAVLGLLWFTDGVKPSDLRLPGRNLRRQLLVALCLALVLIPAVYGVNWLTLQAAKWVGVPQPEHSFTKLVQAGSGSGAGAVLE